MANMSCEIKVKLNSDLENTEQVACTGLAKNLIQFFATVNPEGGERLHFQVKSSGTYIVLPKFARKLKKHKC